MSLPSRLLAGALLALVLLAAGCGRHLQQSLGGLGNQRPVVLLESSPAATDDPQALAARLAWRGFDPDGRIDHFLVTEEVGAFDRAAGWTASTDGARSLSWRRPAPGRAVQAPGEAPFRFFGVKAVDDGGAESEVAYRAFFGENVAPTVTIVRPQPGSFGRACPPDLTILWSGSDPDGPDGRPWKYKYRLLTSADPNWTRWATHPDSIRIDCAPAFAGWDSVDGKTTEVRYTGLTPGRGYLFVITALDKEGAYDPVFSLTKNVFGIYIGYDELSGARLTFFTSLFSYTYPWPQWPPGTDVEDLVVRLQAPPGKPLTVGWRGENHYTHRAAVAYRWAVDIADFLDETTRRGPHDVRHWSAWDSTATAVTIDERMLTRLPAGETHRLFVEDIDELGLKSLGVLEIRFVAPAFDRDLLIVDDTRLRADILSPTQPPGRTDSLRAPSYAWPTAAELDTFLYAVGGVRWRMTPNGTLSQPGIFHGYRFDTLGTRGAIDPTVSAELLGHYRHIVWLADPAGADMTGPPTSLTTPIMSLRSMSAPNRRNTLAEWVAAGGSLWALGGSFADVTNVAWNSALNDGPGGRVYSSLGTNPELGPTRFMYDYAHWRSSFTSARTSGFVVWRSPGAGPPFPMNLLWKDPTTDPVWPYRTLVDFYGDNPIYGSVVRGVEYLTEPNAILEDQDPRPRKASDAGVLDTLMNAMGPTLPGTSVHDPSKGLPVMTLYRGAECGPVLFSGVDLWHWRRAQCAALVDAVLQGQWGLVREAPMARAGAGGVAAKR